MGGTLQGVEKWTPILFLCDTPNLEEVTEVSFFIQNFNFINFFYLIIKIKFKQIQFKFKIIKIHLAGWPTLAIRKQVRCENLI